MNLLTRLTTSVTEERYTLNEYLNDLAFSFNGHSYPLAPGPAPLPGVPAEGPPSSFRGMVEQVYQRNGVVAGCMAARMWLISEARFKWRSQSDRKIYGTEALGPLERPTPDETAGTILARFEQDASLAGNGYRVRMGRGIHRVRPDWMSIVLGSNMAESYEIADAPDATVVGYVYLPDNGKNYKPLQFLPADVAHYAPEPSPLNRFVGQSWITQVLSEIDTDRQMTEHKSRFLEHGVPPFAIKYPEEITRGDQGQTRAKELVEQFQKRYLEASSNWDALHLFGGADPVPLGVNFRDIDFKAVQGAGETRIAMRARVPAAVLGISEGLQGSALNAGNFGQARRQFGEQYAYPSWRLMCEALAPLVDVPAGSELWYDTTDVAFLHEDAKDAADVLLTQATAIRQLVDGGFKADEAVLAITGGQLSTLVGNHTDLYSVQLQPPGTSAQPPNEEAA